ncbi:hypothetical protein BT69DRAFT_1350313 [Atractiella rhizophila]|nr:hypothetical protein BT69DRAFT_1350313 [Atractiella rhizophila]
MSWLPAASEQVSSLCGVLSICSWLFAQLPQVIANFRNGSASSLSLPFLISWAAGDTLNLLGCILTHQLPFQTYLATYFVTVDCILLYQFFYYSRVSPPDPYSPYVYEEPVDDSVFITPAHDRPFSWSSHGPPVPLVFSTNASGPPIPSFLPEERDASGSAPGRNRSVSISRSEDDEDEGLRDSWHSDMSIGRGRTRGPQAHWRPISSLVEEREHMPTIAGSPNEAGESSMTITRRQAEESDERTRMNQQLNNGGVKYLAVFALFSLSSLHFHLSRSSASTSTSSGRFLSPRSLDESFRISQAEGDDPFVLWVGRLSAWVCTSFYLISRLPQILKNFRRRSIAGLSVLLFLMAFGGNFFYVLSILLSPERAREGYWWDELPYLLGSGGTLGGDAIIVGQFWAWGMKEPEEKSWYGGSSRSNSRSPSRARSRRGSLLV